MPVFAIATEDAPEIRRWFKRMNDKLSSPSWLQQPMSGGVGSISRATDRMYVVAIDPVYPRFIFNGMFLFLMVAAVTFQFVIGWYDAALYVYYFTALCVIMVSMFWTSRFYITIIRIQLWRLMKRRIVVKECSTDVLRRLANGKV